MRLYLVLAESTPLVSVEASSPGAALRKAEKGKGDPHSVDGGMAVAFSRITRATARQHVLPGQLTLDDQAAA